MSVNGEPTRVSYAFVKKNMVRYMRPGRFAYWIEIYYFQTVTLDEPLYWMQKKLCLHIMVLKLSGLIDKGFLEDINFTRLIW